GVEFALGASREREELLVILRSEGKLANGFGADGLAGRGVGGLDAGDLGSDFDLFGYRAGLQRDGDSGGFGDANLNGFCLCLREAGFVDDDRISAGRKESGDESAVRGGVNFADDRFGGPGYDLHFGVGDGRTRRVNDYAADGAGGAALSANGASGKKT